MLQLKQQGSVLMISMVILLILTLLGLSGMNATILQERMASNVQEKNTAFQAAEAGLRDGEDYVSQFPQAGRPVFSMLCSSGVCEPASSASQTDVWNDADKVNWDTRSNTIAYGTNTTPTPSSVPLVSQQPHYIVEELQVAVPGTSLAFNSQEPWYRITSMGYGEQSGNNMGTVMLQSVYRN